MLCTRIAARNFALCPPMVHVATFHFVRRRLHVACCMLHFSFLAELSAVEATSALFMPMTVLSLPMAALAGLLTDRHGQQIIV